MKLLLHGGTVFYRSHFVPMDVLIEDGLVVDISPSIGISDGVSVFNFTNNDLILPGFTDLHVHFREPGFSYKETILSGSLAAAHGGYTTVCTMPNLSPAPDCVEHLAEQQRIIESDACIRVSPVGCITKGQKGRGELVDFSSLAPHVCAFSDDGRGIQSEDLMRKAMTLVAKTHRPITAHCEDESLLHGGCIHEGAFAAAKGLPGISSQSEWRQVQRDLQLVEETGCPYHICHISTKETVELLRQAKAKGLPVTGETGPHYLVLCDNDLADDGRFKMNPPIRSADDRDALLIGLADGTVDCIATDHAPHSKEEKSKGLRNSLMGVVGLETAFPILYTKLVETGKLPLSTLVRALTSNPCKCFGLEGGELTIGGPANITVFSTGEDFTITPDRFLSMGRSSPFTGEHVSSVCRLTLYQGNIAYRHPHCKEEGK